MTGAAYWGTEWDYAKEQCERNAQAEGVGKRINFQKGDAEDLLQEMQKCIPAILRMPMFLKDIGVIYGIR
ncbi:MAG: hypothetical protein QM793_10755 [Muricomes sp.]